MATTDQPAAGGGLPDGIEKVFDAVRRAHWLAQVMDDIREPIAVEDLPRHELWLAIAERLDAARAAVDEVVFGEVA